MTRYQKPADKARTAVIDATVIAATIDDALAALQVGLGGFPTSTPGAGPAPLPIGDDVDVDVDVLPPLGPKQLGHMPTEKYTVVERNATQIDKARKDQAVLLKSLDAAARQLARAARITNRWAFASIDASSVRVRLSEIDEGIWCQHCSKFGRYEVRKPGHVHCDWCVRFNIRRKQLPPKECWDARDYNHGQLSVQDEIRILERIKADRKAAEAARKATARAAAKLSKPESAVLPA